MAVVVAITGAIVAALWPAFRASRLNPVEALRQ
jgi:ABC-type lipoprotein release transport system permease subunit